MRKLAVVIKVFSKIITNILTALYEPFGFSLLLSFLAMLFYLYAYEPISAGRDWKKCHNYMVSEIHREYNRRFSNVKIQTDSGERQAFMETKQGLEKCLTEFLNGERRFQFRDWKEEAVLNRISGDKSRLREIRGIKNKVKYAVYRYIK